MMKKKMNEGKSYLRSESFEAFRSFYKDSAQSGETLSSASPIKLRSTRSLITRRTTLLRESFKPDVNVMATSLLVPSELSWALNCVPLNLEMFSSLLASHSKIIELSNKGSLTAPRCSFINSVKGALVENLIPKPDILVSSSAYCEGVSYVFEDFRKEFGTDHFHIDLPVYADKESVPELAVQLKNLFLKMADSLGISHEEALGNFKKVMYNSTLARKEFLELWQFRHENGPVDLGLEPLHWHMQFLPMWGDEKAVGICQRLKEEFVDHVSNYEHDDEAVPIGFFGLIPYGRTEMWSILKENKAYMAFEGVNFLGDYILPNIENFESLTVDELFQNLAHNLISVPMRGGNIIEKSDFFMKEASDMGAKGMMIISHEHCQLLAPRLHELEDQATKNNLKVVSLGGDCILGMPKGPTNFRLRTFLTSITNVKANELDYKSLNPVKEQTLAGYRLGVDFGSGFSKYMLLDEKLDVKLSGVVSSGIDYPGLLHDITRKLAIDGPVRLGVAGIGSDNPIFKNLVHSQTTEINALIGSCRQLFQQRENLLVIDIGTQDVKILHFDNMYDAPWINTNKSCGAGTGMVLVQILERWKQTMPNVTFDTLDKWAMEATESEVINTTCGIFAVTNVVSALVQASEERRKSILRGLYDYVATQAIKLLPSQLQRGHEVYLTGGVASHETLKEVFRQRGFTLINPEKDIHPQFLVAFGTALSVPNS
ncbi:2-hydroxyacyl-CoA dehydratase [Carboxylicivirga caseinilyticus]|uniref:2-hydroxyacyl-CoA dehydratase n=1 Tax=Carboxylicivirga caseinilyticus TaxID=3417572 RepID=UPI003D358913|nr:2-hydroxyacyl-CoA dehydratase [Marinilabiliaceae bacterium A049]